MRLTYRIKYIMREKMIVSVPSPMGTTMCVNTVSKAKATEFFVV